MRRFFALLLTAVLALSLLAGCTKSQEDAQQQTGTSSDVSMPVPLVTDPSTTPPRREPTAWPRIWAFR